MPVVPVIRSFVRNLFSPRGRESDLDQEIQSHLEMLTDEFVQTGMTREEAQRAARLEVGGTDRVKEQVREARIGNWLHTVFSDCRYSIRRLRKSPGFTVVAILTLVLGIGTNTAVFSVINSVLFKPLPYPDPDQLVALWLRAPGAAGLANFQKGLLLSPSMYFAFSENNQTFQSLGIWTRQKANVTGLARPEEVNIVFLTDGVLETLAVPPLAGRELTAADQVPNGPKNVMLSYGYWQRQFGGDRSMIGRSIIIDSEVRTIVGVMPRGFRVVDQDFDILVPLGFERNKQPLAGFGYQGIGRLKPGVTIAEADADIARTIPIWMDSFTNGPVIDPHWYVKWRITPDLHSLKQEVIGNIGSVLWVVTGTIGLVLVIACINLANLLLVRAEARHLELSIRAALGAGRGRIARELLLESVLLGIVGGALSIAAAASGLRLLTSMGPANLPRLNEISLDYRSFLFTFALSLVSGLLLGSIPAWKYSRSRNTASLAAGRTASASLERHRSRNILVVAQVAMALVLLVCAALMLRTFQQLRAVDPGFADASSLQTLHIAIPESSISDPRMVGRVENDIADKLAAIPGVTSVGFAGSAPMEGTEAGWDIVTVEGKSYEGDPPLRLFNYASPGYFRALGTRLLAGRDFTWKEIYDLEPKVIVSENFAKESWGSAEAAIGKRIHSFPPRTWYEVIGVAQDMRYNGVDEKAPAVVYWPLLRSDPYPGTSTYTPRSVTFAVRSSRAGTSAFLNEVQEAVWQVNADLPVASVRTMQEIYSKSLARTSFTLVMLGIAAAMALALGIIGIYGVISYAVSQRAREIGIRLALGAQRHELRWMFVRSALALTGIGVAIGLGAAAAVSELMRTLLFGVSPLDLRTFIVVPLVLAAAAALAGYLPARRAAQLDPMVALRCE
jgi:predicted permease